MRAYRIDPESDAIFDLEISRRAPLELGRISDERFAQLRPEMDEPPKLCLSGAYSPEAYLSMGAFASLDTIVIGALNPC